MAGRSHAAHAPHLVGWLPQKPPCRTHNWQGCHSQRTIPVGGGVPDAPCPGCAMDKGSSRTPTPTIRIVTWVGFYVTLLLAVIAERRLLGKPPYEVRSVSYSTGASCGCGRLAMGRPPEFVGRMGFVIRCSRKWLLRWFGGSVFRRPGQCHCGCPGPGHRLPPAGGTGPW